MKTYLLALVVLLGMGSSALASDSGLYFTSGEYKGQKVESAGFIGYYDICFAGNPYEARKELLNYMHDDIEKEASYVRVDKKNGVLVFGYVNTKCTDDGELTAAQCREVRSAGRCK